MPGLSDYRVLNLELGNKRWPESRIMPKRETFGASFFEWDSGNRYRARAAAFLRLSGLVVVGADDAERARVSNLALTMPSWPSPGWIVIDGNTIIIKLSEYTPLQKNQLCAAGVNALCENLNQGN